MSRPCACCSHERREEIDAKLMAGDTNKSVAEAVGLNAAQIARHKRRCLQPMSDLDRIQLLESRSEELWTLSASNGDVRTMATALQQQLRGLEFTLKHREEAAQSEASSDLPLDLAQWTENQIETVRRYLDRVLTSAEMLDVILPIGGLPRAHKLPLRN